MLEMKGATSLDPRPISVADFWAVHDAAKQADDHMFCALMITALNATMYSSEVGALTWDEVDLKRKELVTNRAKTGVARVAVLWDETVKALQSLPRDRDTIFNTSVRSFTSFSVAAHFRRYRQDAELGDKVTFSMVRDAAYTIACQTVSLDKARVLAGHRLPGSSDHYIKRNPQFVAEACEAIRREFFGAQKRPARVRRSG